LIDPIITRFDNLRYFQLEAPCWYTIHFTTLLCVTWRETRQCLVIPLL